VDDQKLSQYAQGTVKKSKREKEKEAAEAKRREEEEHAAKAYAEFLDAFDADEGAVGAPARRSAKSSSFVRSSRDSGAAYTPSGPSRPEAHSRSMRAFEPSKVCRPISEGDHPYMTAVSVSSSCTKAERQTRYGRLLRRD
jgi:U2-associated protein SR140